MGTDIHGVFQRYDESKKRWENIDSTYDERRHYLLFAVLADVRNGVGFAGIETGEEVDPIDEPRGLPDDFEYAFDDESDDADLGDHSFSWLSGDEMLAWFESVPTVVNHVGVLDRKAYLAWDKTSEPSDYCGFVLGLGVVTIDDGEQGLKPHWTHVRCTWRADLKNELAYFFEEVARLVTDHGRIRFVFGFDS